jgi:hypothetical protein
VWFAALLEEDPALEEPEKLKEWHPWKPKLLPFQELDKSIPVHFF